METASTSSSASEKLQSATARQVIAMLQGRRIRAGTSCASVADAGLIDRLVLSLRGGGDLVVEAGLLAGDRAAALRAEVASGPLDFAAMDLRDLTSVLGGALVERATVSGRVGSPHASGLLLVLHDGLQVSIEARALPVSRGPATIGFWVMGQTRTAEACGRDEFDAAGRLVA